MTFTSFAFRPELLKSLGELGYETPTPIQTQTIPLLLDGHDVIGCAQTGTGKTAAFALPILQHLQPGLPGPQALIITPTRELAEQIDQNIKAYAKHLKVRCQSVYGGVNIGPQETKLRRGVDIVVATPGRLLDHLQRGTISLKQVKYLVLDEADRMLDMGFLPDIKRILKHVPSERQTLLFSATMPKEIEALVKSLTRDAKSVNISPRNATADTVEQLVYRVEKANKLRLLMHLLNSHSMYSVIVFSRTRHGADRIARQLGKQDISVARIHADRSQNQRQQALDGFKSGKFQVLVATDIAARGIDVENISHVINFDTPTHAEDYVHRIGRTGRADATGDAFTFTCPEEDKYLKAIEKLIGRTLPLADPKAYAADIKPGAEALAQAPARKPAGAVKSSSPKPAATGKPSSPKPAGAGKPNSPTVGSAQPAKAARTPAGQPRLKDARPALDPKKAEARRPRRDEATSQAVRPDARLDARQPRAGRDSRDSRDSRDTRAKAMPNGRQPAQGRGQALARGQQDKPVGAQQDKPGQARGQQARPVRGQSDRQAQGPNRQNEGFVSRSGGGGLRVVKRSKSSYPLSGEVDYIDLDEEQTPQASGDDRQPRNIDVNDWGYPRNPVYEPWKKDAGSGRSSGGPQGRGPDRNQDRNQDRGKGGQQRSGGQRRR